MANTCTPGTNYRVENGDFVASSAGPARDPGDNLTVERIRVDNRAGTETSMGYDCVAPSDAVAAAMGAAPFPQPEPVVITVTLQDFREMPVAPMVAHAGPPDGWIPVNMVNVLHAEGEAQTLSVELLGTPVSIRATPTSYHWDLGDGNTITTTNAGEPYPSEEVTSTYRHEGWYDITLTTTFSGEFSVAGGPWQAIDGTIDVQSDPVELYAKSMESRLVDGETEVDEDEDPWIPPRSSETEGPQDEQASDKTI